ncbi:MULTISPECIES: HAMP domain-containing methyl-accepting chemotaxis protein [unclassified Thalassospira]|uniref:methyl-accepting chemotaxis protein n=1 Tax=unclassified Thalassospira TaxID=2648997 RepID=UPI0007A5ED28|nr:MULTISPECIES: HAMP domain-containing methyl-accepting chemotaxis protein [unclassified Thalassospira]KZC97848.1 chemotaxis protein [Thalassospira sp. MCCC 1A02898]ONH87981.1 methyl-accepting chemotaxis protein [Thalassospira sp. MCCC 1A02803]
MRFLDNLSIGPKTLLVPVFLMIVIVAMGIATVATLESEKDTLTSLRVEAYERRSDALTLSNALNEAHGSLFRILTWDSNGINAAVVPDLREQVAKLEEELAPLAQRLAAVGGDAFTENYAKYMGQVNQFLVESEMNIYGALEVIAQADETFQALQAPLNDILAQSHEIATTSFADAYAQAEALQRVFVIVALIVVVVAVVVSVFVSRRISRPMTDLAELIEQISNGDLDVSVRGGQRADEIGKVARSVMVLRDQSKEAEVLRQERERVRGLERQRQQNLIDATNHFQRVVQEALSGFDQEFSSLNGSASDMEQIATLASARSADANQHSEQVLHHIEAVSQTTASLSEAIAEIGQQAQNSAEVAGRARSESEQSRALFEQLTNATQRIGDIVSLIEDIANQTNLLALNATIEAARAGDAGKGFAVVAGEVKNLASQTARATEDIASQVEEIRGLTDNVVNALHGVADVIGEVDQSAAAIAAAVEEQQASTAGISDSIQDANGGMRTVAEAVGALDNETARVHNGSANVTRATSTLNDEATKLRNAIDGFLEQIEKNKAEA